MKQYIYIIMCLAVSLFSSCQEEVNTASGSGYLQISSVKLDKTVVAETKSSTADELYALDILKDGVVVKHVDDWKQLDGESLLLPTGAYVLKAYSAERDSTNQGLGVLPYYLGTQQIQVEKDVVKSAEITCSLLPSMITLSFSDNFRAAFSDYQCEIKNENVTALFVATEERPAYFVHGQALTADLTVTNRDGKTFTHNKIITEKAKSRYHYKVSYDVTNEGTGDFTITVDETTRNYDIVITVPLTSVADSDLEIVKAEAWGQFAYLFGNSKLTDATNAFEFQYKKVTDENWESVAAESSGSGYKAKTGKLEFGTDYNYRIVCGEKVSVTDIFTTEKYQEIPNLNFDTWTLKGKNWYANPVADNYNNSEAYWATGNEGVTSFLAGSNNPITVAVEGDDAYKGKAAKMSTLTGITLVKSAAGNLFVGKYKTDMGKPSASVSFGRPYSGARPVSLSGYFKYLPKTINEGSVPGSLTTDQCNIYVKLWAEDGTEIGFGEFVGADEVTTYTKFSFDILYTNTELKPASITIVATSSRYGGEFSGNTVVGQVGSGSTLWVDEFEFSYY